MAIKRKHQLAYVIAACYCFTSLAVSEAGEPDPYTKQKILQAARKAESGQQIEGIPVTREKADDGDWRVNADIPLGAAGIGATLRVSNWRPKGKVLELYLVGPKGEQKLLVNKNNPISFDKHGSLAIDFPYRKYALYRGTWAILAVLQDQGKKPEMHMARFNVGNY